MRLSLENDAPATGVATPFRDQVLPENTWDLTVLYESPERWNEAFLTLQNSYDGVTRFKGRVGQSPETLRDCLEAEKELNVQIERLGHFASLRCSEDGSNTDNLSRASQLNNLLTRIGEATAFIAPEIQAIDEVVFRKWIADPTLVGWRVVLEKLRRMKPHVLSTNEERLLALSQCALRGHRETFSQLTNVDMKFGSLVTGEGEARHLSQSSYPSFLLDSNRELRRRAFLQFYAEFEDHQFTLAASLANAIKADVFSARARNHSSAREAALFGDDVPVSVYDNLIRSVQTNLKPLFRYYALRKRVLGLPAIHHYDTYIPLRPPISMRIHFDEAVTTVLAALQPLGSEYVNVLGDGLRRHRWCDRYENKGKRSGAFSSSSYGSPPFIMMNYKEDVFADVYTLAHEAGHSMHTWYAQRHQSFQDYSYPIFLAEVASTFNEELLTHHLLSEMKDQQMRAYIISRQIDDLRGTLYRQTMFAEFEQLVHDMEEAGEPLTVATFRKTYRELLDGYFGPDFVIDSQLEIECLRIPHFYDAFYVYKYATGISAAVWLSNQVLTSGSAEPYLSFLKSGGARFPLPTLAEAGVDISSPAPIEAALALFSRRVDELETLLDQRDTRSRSAAELDRTCNRAI